MNELHTRALLDSTALGSRESLADLYDIFATETYSICAHYVQNLGQRDSVMLELWTQYWQDAPRLVAGPGSVRDSVMAMAHEIASSFAPPLRVMPGPELSAE